jgi:DNA (cytosine-5)-methyltransferase 1
MKFRAIDAFAGAGGLSLGLRTAGWDIALAFDNDPIAVSTYRQNLGPHAYVVDAEEISPSALLELAELEEGECDLLAGGPPCQGFSLQRRGPRNDPRNRLVERFGEFVLAIRPRVFLMENVAGLATVRGRHLVDGLVSAAESDGYTCYAETVNAFDYGVAQHRLRRFIIGFRDVATEFRWPRPTGRGPRTVREALAGLPSPPTDGSPHPDVSNHYGEARLAPINRERIRHVPQGGGREHLPPHLQLKCHQSGHRHLDTYGRLSWDEPSGTITARFDSFTRGRFAHPKEHRSITLREGARLQGFADDFVFLGNREDGARLIGNAVPPPLAKAVGRAVLRTLQADDRIAKDLAEPVFS